LKPSDGHTATPAQGNEALELARTRYLDLLEASLRHALWSPTGAPMEAFLGVAKTRTKVLYRLMEPILRRSDLAIHQRVDPSNPDTGARWPYHADTMIGRDRLHSLRSCTELVIKEGIPGDLLEAGVWRGGATILMRAVLLVHGITDRRVFVADSFRGLPPPDVAEYPDDEGSALHRIPFLAVSVDEVKENFARYDLLDDQVVFVEGWFRDTLPNLDSDRLAIIRLDGDLYESTMDGLTNLYDKLSPGGFCIIDDYSIAATRRAVAEFREERGIDDEIVEIDWTGVYWRKS
jgi:O-methyltransferase